MTFSFPDPVFCQRLLRTLFLCSASLMTASCAYQYGERHAPRAPASSYEWSPEVNAQLAACRTDLRDAAGQSGESVGIDDIRLATWNVQKNHDDDWREDFEALTGESDLILMQEVSLVAGAAGSFGRGHHWSFAPGYRVRDGVTGVLTLSRSEPLARCSFVATEPWLRTPKATSITAYRMAASDMPLAVVNIHAVNFTLGIEAFERQFRLIGEALRDHRGPVILSGDLNTWRAARMQVVDEITRTLGLRPVAFDNDRRVRRFGYALDHIFVRDLETLGSSTMAVDTSDHNPISATFGISTAIVAP